MSRKTSIPQKRISFDRGIQSYRSCDKGYAMGMRNTTFQEVRNSAGDARVVRESEFAKPYGEQYEEPHEDFWAMEYGAPDLPPWGWDYPTMQDPASGWAVTFFCDIDPCWADGETRIFNAKCGWEIVSASIEPAALSVVWTKTQIEVTALSGSMSGSGTLTINMKAVFKVGKATQSVTGSHSDISVPECDEDILCDDSGIAWDYINSPSQIARGQTLLCYITDSTGNGGPYTWTVNNTNPPGYGFSFPDGAVTSGLTNNLKCAADACGQAYITVTGCDGVQIKGWVWCTWGNWGATHDYCQGCATHSGLGCTDYIVEGGDYPAGYKKRVTSWGCGGGNMIRTDCPSQCPWNFGVHGASCGDCSFPPHCRAGAECTGNRWVFESYWQDWRC